MRAAQDFDAIDVPQVEHGAKGGAEIHVVEVEADAGFEGEGKVVLSDPADVGDRRLAAAGARLLQRHIGSELIQIDDVGEGMRLQLISADRRERDRDSLQIFRSVAGGDCDLREFVARLGHRQRLRSLLGNLIRAACAGAQGDAQHAGRTPPTPGGHLCDAAMRIVNFLWLDTLSRWAPL